MTALAFADVLSAETLRRLEEELERLRGGPPLNRVIAVVNQKGGAGKTTTTCTLGAVWAAWGLRVREATPVDVTLLDCRPSLGVLTVGQLAAAGEVLIPLGASGLDLPGLIELNDTLKTIRKRLNPGLPVAALVICADADTKLSRKVRNQLEADYPDALHFRIRHSVRVKEAPFAHKPLTDFAPEVPATQEYVKLAAAMLLRRSAVTA